ncbi:MAG: chalcone isomerase family protein [Desulfuromonadales bacterium]|nr:chalcone isomerase family protein [Desulfuromonadales bacterium]
MIKRCLPGTGSGILCQGALFALHGRLSVALHGARHPCHRTQDPAPRMALNSYYKTLLLLPLFLLLAMAQAHADPADDMVVRGEGNVRYMGFIRVYDAELLAPADAVLNDVLQAQRSFCLRLTYKVALTAENFVTAAEEILLRQYSQSELASYRPQIDRLHQAYRDVTKGDRYRLCYDAERQLTQLIFNDEVLVSVISPEFAILYAGIWLDAEQPLDAGLRNRLLASLTNGRG